MAATNVQAFSGDVEITSNLEVGTANLFVDTVNFRVGIGTTNPGAPLEIYTPTTGNSSTLILKRDVSSYGESDDGAAIEFKTRFTGNSATYGQVRVRGVDDNLGDSGEGGFAFDTLQDQVYYERMRIKHDGNVGIGTTNPGAKMDIYTGATSTVGLSFDRFASGNYRTDIYQNTYGLDFRVGYAENTPGSVLYLKRLSDGSKEVEINGNVGIGTDNPGLPLELYTGNGANYHLRLKNIYPRRKYLSYI